MERDFSYFDVMTLSLINRYFRNVDGNLSIITGVVGIMLLTAVGASLDGGRMFSTKQSLQSITDAAALSAAMPAGVSASYREQLAKNSIQSHAKNMEGLKISATTINVKDAEGQVYVSLTAEVPMLFGALLGDDLRRVSVSSLAEESNSKSLNPLSISLVLDLSSSMGDRLDNGSKLASVNMAVSDMLNSINNEFGGEVAAATRISTGVYPFNWGMIDGETVALEPGTNTVLTSMTNLSLSDGSVPTTAMERAVSDQIQEMKDVPGRDRFIVYVTDGKVEEDKSDVVGRYLRKPDLFRVNSTKRCLKIAQELAELDALLEPDLVDPLGLSSVLSEVVATVTSPPPGQTNKKDKLLKKVKKSKDKKKNTPNGNAWGHQNGDEDEDEKQKKMKSDKHAGHNHANDDVKSMADRVELREEFLELCQPVQTMRVVEACETARDQGVSIIAINLSGEDGIASNTTNNCINGLTVDNDDPKVSKKKKKDAPSPVADARQPMTLPSGMKVRVSADGQSFAGDANTLEEIREMLSAVLPDGKAERRVRLVG